MSVIHHLSPLVALPEYDIFGVPGTQIMVEETKETTHMPLSAITNAESPIQFEFETGIDEYLDLSRCELKVKLYIKLEKSVKAKENDKQIKTKDWKNVSPINYLLNTMFKQVKLEIDQTVISGQDKYYSYLAYMNAIFNISKEVKETHMQTACWFKDKTSFMNTANLERSELFTPNIVDVNTGQKVELIGQLHFDLADQIKNIPGGHSFRITLLPHEPKYYMLNTEDLVSNLIIEDVNFIACRKRTNASVVSAHIKNLRTSNYLFFIKRREIKTFTLQSGVVDFQLNHVDYGQVPKRITVGFVNNEAYNGNYQQNPLYFKNYNIRHLQAFVDNMPYPQRPIEMDFDNNNFKDAYRRLFKEFNQLKKPNIDITLKEFKDGFTLFPINLTPNRSNGVVPDGTTCLNQNGNLRLELKFKYPLTENVTVIVFCEYDNKIEFDISRNIIKDFH
jgi:hypothetical protein